MKNVKARSGTFYFFLFILIFSNSHNVSSQVVINELMPHPAGGSTDQVFQSMYNSTPTSGHEWVELYNTDPCQPADISCWTIGGMDGGTNGGGFSFPNGTVIPPLGFIVIGGPNAPNVDFNLNDAAYNTTSGWLWTSGAARWHLPNGDGWLVLYDNTGAAVDGVYWTFSSADPTKITTDATYDGQPQQGSNCGGSTLASAETVFNAGDMEYISPATVAGQSYERTQDGSTTWALTASPTAKACNGTCITANPFTIIYTITTEACLGDNNGAITISSINGGVGPFSYAWSNSSSANSITNLSTGIYSVTIEDLGTGCQFDTTFSLTPGPNCAGCPSPWNINTSATPNTVCNGVSIPCAIPGSVIINEVMPRPAGGATDQVFQSMFNSTPAYGHEWVELYNPSPCNSMDLSCYTIGGMDGGTNGGGYSFPAGTTIPPLSFLVIGGPNAPNVDINLNAVGSGDLWTSGAARWHLPNGDGWLAIYDPSGTPVNGVYWTFAGNDPGKISTDGTYDGQPQQGSSCGGVTLSSAETVFNSAGLDYIPFVTADGQSFSRSADGGSTWLIGAHTSGLCNAICATPGGGSSTCDGTATAIPTNGTAPYSYVWDAAAGAQTTQTATALCAGNYCVQITDAQGCTEIVCVTIIDNITSITPSFAAVAPICSGDPLAALPTTSTNGITGTWSPALNNTATTTYTFTPTAGQCAATTTLTITVNPNVTPSFAAVAPICSGDPLAALPTTSTNGITGTWSPAMNNAATTTYTFTPTAGQCAATTTIAITVNPNVTPSFAVVAPICSGDPLAALPTTSTNGITGTWSPALNNTATTTYTFTPTAGQCAATTALTITVNPISSSTQSITQCSGLNYTFPDGVTHTNIVANESYLSVLTSVAGCDSNITTNITVVSGFTTSENIFLCSGDDYTYPDGTIHTNIVANESHVSNLISSGGCDSTVTTSISVNPVYAITENVNVCQNDIYTFPDGSSSVIVANLNHLSNLSTGSGCDSIITTQITMIPLSNSTVTISVCENTAYTFPDGSTQVITAPVTQISTLVSVNGCDSLVTTNIIVNPIYQQTENVSLCEGGNYTFPDGTTHLNITVDEQYQSNFLSVFGCDSVVITNINVIQLPAVNAGFDFSLCEGTPIVLNASGANTYSWDQGMNNGVPSILAPGNYTFTVTGTSVEGCQASDLINVTVYATPTPIFTGNNIQGCAPLNVEFTVSGVGPSGSFIWNFGNGTSGSGDIVQTQFTNAGTFDVSLTYTDLNGCAATITYVNYIEVYESPEASFTYLPQQPDMLNPEVNFTNSSSGATNYQWLFGDGSESFDENPSHVYSGDAGNSYTVTLISSNSVCADTAQAIVTVQDVIVFYVPNVFTPDGDEHNEIFKPVFSSGYDPYNYHLMIFNRWGELIFESYNAEVGWNGTYSDQGLVLDDVYVWKIDFKETMSDKRHVHYGHVTVLK